MNSNNIIDAEFHETPDPVKLAKQELALREQELELAESLPHLYGWKFYSWSRKFFESTNRENILCAANQISKSSTQIRKMIHWATCPELWPTLWTRKPLQFWYLYPTYTVATIEFRKKFVPEFMPRGKMKEHPVYGWKVEHKNALIVAIHFNSGISCYFKTYAMDAQDLQSGSVDAIFLDEECPEHLLAELQMRLIARQGYFHAVFTPTLGQEMWRCAMEEIGKKAETFKGAFKQQVSMFDCLEYDDGTKSNWSIDTINRAIAACKSEAQIQRRVYGKCVSDEGLKYPGFERKKNMTEHKPHPPSGWDIYVGADVGGGGTDNHPSAIVFVAVNPSKTRGVVFKGWRGNDVITTASDVVHKVIELSQGLEVTKIYYDFSSRDFYTIAQSMGLNVEPAEKSHSIGEQVINVLFRNQWLEIMDSAELEPLAVELTTLKALTPKRFAIDDYVDAMRYAITRVEWDWSHLNIKTPDKIIKKTSVQMELEDRRNFVSSEDLTTDDYQDEINAWNQLLGNDYGL